MWGDKPNYADAWTLAAYNHNGDVVEVTASVKKIDQSSAEVRFKESTTSGESFGPVVTVGSIPKAIPILIRERQNGQLVILDGAKVLFFSEDGGENWDPV